MSINKQEAIHAQHLTISHVAMSDKIKSIKRGRLIKRAVLLIATALLLSSCSPYASLDIGVPFKVGPVYVNPSIGVGGRL